MEARTEVGHPRLADGARLADVGRHQRGKASQVGFGHETGGKRRRERAGGQALILGAVAARAPGCVPVGHRSEQDEIGKGACLGVAPGREDRSLRDSHGHGAHDPPPAEPNPQQHPGAQDKCGSGEPDRTHAGANWFLQQVDPHPAETLGRAEQMDQAMRQDNAHHHGVY